jgi:hypothetical protein
MAWTWAGRLIEEALGWLLLAFVPFGNDPAPRTWRRLRTVAGPGPQPA